MILATRFTFIVERSWKNMYFHPKLAWPPATYDVISHNHSNWPSLNLSQKSLEGWTKSYWKRQVLVFYSLGEKVRKTLERVASTSPPPLFFRGLILKPTTVIDFSSQISWCKYETMLTRCKTIFDLELFVEYRVSQKFVPLISCTITYDQKFIFKWNF